MCQRTRDSSCHSQTKEQEASETESDRSENRVLLCRNITVDEVRDGKTEMENQVHHNVIHFPHSKVPKIATAVVTNSNSIQSGRHR